MKTFLSEKLSLESHIPAVDFGGGHGADSDSGGGPSASVSPPGHDENGVTGSKIFTRERLSMFVETRRLWSKQHELRNFRWMFQNKPIFYRINGRDNEKLIA